jgi:class 3 adenylate cyclase
VETENHTHALNYGISAPPSIALMLAAVAGPVAWMVTKEKSEASIVSLAMEESRRLIDHYHVNPADQLAPQLNADKAAKAIACGLFDIAEIYDGGGLKLAESMTDAGAAIESLLPRHVLPNYVDASYASFKLPGDQWILRVFVPLHGANAQTHAAVTGYFEGIRIVPAWQQSQNFSDALTVALMVVLASLLCGVALFPVVVRLAAVLFTDFSDFTQAASTMPPDRMVAELNDIFAAFDEITDECGVEKIKTIGDAYMAAAGVPTPCANHAQRCVNAGLRMVRYLDQRNQTAAFKWSLRVGIHTGPVVAGVVGTKKYAFDIWGDTVNIASRMESSGEIGRVNVSAYTYDLIRKDYDCEYRGKVAAKGKGVMDMYFVRGALA